jgi:hypothetical protein
MTTKTQIPQGAFSEMMSAFRYFDKVDEGDGYDRLNSKKDAIQESYQLTNDEMLFVENWAHTRYYYGN